MQEYEGEGQMDRWAQSMRGRGRWIGGLRV